MTLDATLPTPSAVGLPSAVRAWQRYPAYKDSGIPWLGEVPAHWDVRRLKHLARLESGHTPSRAIPEYWENCTIPWVSLSDVGKLRDGTVDVIRDTAEKISELGLANSSARLLPAGTVILSRTASVGYSAILGQPMATTQDFADWICGASLRPRYLLHTFRAMTSEFRRLTMGSTHQTIYMPDIAQFVVVHPSIAEQDHIVTFIDREMAKIDALVEKKRRLLGLIEERRAALISHAVTRGLDPSVPMKDSGVEWLGQVPAHWSVERLKFSLASIEQGWCPSSETRPAAPGEWGILKAGASNNGVFRPDENKALAPDVEPQTRYSIRAGDLIVSRATHANCSEAPLWSSRTTLTCSCVTSSIVWPSRIARCSRRFSFAC